MKTVDLAKSNAVNFTPSVWHPYYIIRSGLFNAIQRNAHYVSGKVLDFGCGSKPYQKLFNAEEYIGLDFENDGHPHDNEQIDFFYDGKSIPFDNNTFDSIVSSEVFEHVFNLPEILKELNRVLKKDGVLLITCPFVWKEHEIPHDYARYTLYALDHLLTNSGFEKVKTDKSGNFVEVIFQLQALFFFDVFHRPASTFYITRKIFETLFFALPNFVGKQLSRLFKKNTLYLNNIVIYKKCSNQN